MRLTPHARHVLNVLETRRLEFSITGAEDAACEARHWAGNGRADSLDHFPYCARIAPSFLVASSECWTP